MSHICISQGGGSYQMRDKGTEPGVVSGQGNGPGTRDQRTTESLRCQVPQMYTTCWDHPHIYLAQQYLACGDHSKITLESSHNVV